MVLNKEEMMEVKGGAAISTALVTTIAAIVGGVVVFISGILNGVVNSKGCK